MTLRTVGRRNWLARLTEPIAHLSGFNLGLVLSAAYFVLHLFAPAEVVLWLWTPAAIVVTLASPVAGLTILAAIGPFTEALSADGRITAAPFLLAALGLSVAVRLLVAGRVPRPSLPIILALAILVGTALGVVHTWIAGGPALGTAAAQLWVPGIGGALTVLLGAAWVGWRGEVGPLVVAVVSIVLAALLSVLDFVSRGDVQATFIGPLLRSVDWWRLGGVIPAPNAAAAIFVVGFAACVVTALIGQQRSVRAVAMLGAGITVVALVLTYSRSGLLAVGVVAAAAVWARWRMAGLVITIAALLLVFGLLVSAGLLRDVPMQAEQDRLTAWVAALRMWLAAPLVGGGFRMFEWVHDGFGTTLAAPHNEWLRLLAEEGLLMGAAGFAFAVLTPLALLRAGGIITTGAGAAAAGLFVVASFNNPFLYTQVNVPAFVVIGTGLGIALRSRTRADPAMGSE